MPRRTPRPSNDNDRRAKPARLFGWDVYRIANRGRWVGYVEAADHNTAVEAASVTYDADIRRLLAVRRREITP
jgi:hypothetical protein